MIYKNALWLVPLVAMIGCDTTRSESDYLEEYNRTVEDYMTLQYFQVIDGAPAKFSSQEAERFESDQVTLEKLIAQWRTVSAPGNLKAHHQSFLATLASHKDVSEKMAKAIRSEDRKLLRQALERTAQDLDPKLRRHLEIARAISISRQHDVSSLDKILRDNPPPRVPK